MPGGRRSWGGSSAAVAAVGPRPCGRLGCAWEARTCSVTLPRAHLLARQVAALPGEPDTLRRGRDLVACRSLRLSTSCDHGADIGAALRSRLSPAPCHRIAASRRKLWTGPNGAWKGACAPKLF